MSKIVITEDSIVSLREELEPLFEKHYQEVTVFKEFPLAPDWELYDFLEKRHGYQMYVARVGGVLVGYVAYFIRGHQHYCTTLYAMDDMIYVDPEYRNFGIGLKLMKFAEQALKQRGVQVVCHHTKEKPYIGGLFTYLGYKLSDLVFVKKL